MSDSLNYVDKCMIAAIATMNASYPLREGGLLRETKGVSNAAIDTMKIKTLAEYYKGSPEKFSTFDPSKMDNNKLMRTYVIPITLPNGQTMDLIVNSKGQDMACVYLDAESKETQFQLTPRMEAEIGRAVKENINGIQTKMDIDTIEEMVKPEDLDQFIKAVADDNLVPKNPRDTITRVKENDSNAEIEIADDEIFEIEDKNNKSPKEVQDEISLEEQRLKTIAEKVGMSLDDMKKFCLENNLTSKTVKGAIEVVNVDVLESLLEGNQLDVKGSVVIIKTQENGLQNRARITDKEGKTLLDKPKYDDKMVSLVPEYDTSEPIRDFEEHKEVKDREEVEYTTQDGKENVAEVEGNSQADTKLFEERFNKLQEEIKQKLDEIENSNMTDLEKAGARKELAAEFYVGVKTIERETGTIATEISDEALDNANKAVEDEAKEKVETAIETTVAAVGTATVATIGIAAVVGEMGVDLAKDLVTNNKNDKEEKEDDDNPFAKYAEGRLPKHLMD